MARDAVQADVGVRGPLRPDSCRYAFEVKWDGFRALVRASPHGATITSRSGYDMTGWYPEPQLGATVSVPVLLDGEIVALDAESKPDFAALWFRSRPSRTRVRRGARSGRP
jgi:bifunctional non-homologous end joining protein LigD